MSAALSNAASFESVEFLKSASAVKGKISIQHDALVEQQKLDKWIVHHCLNCDSYVGEGANEDTILINGNLVRDEAQLITMMNCDNYSMPFKIILKPIDALPRFLQVNINSDVRVKSLFDKLQDYIQSDSARTEAEIRRLTLECHQRRQQAEKDFQRIVTLIESTERSTKSLSIESLTPPVTPESVNDKMMTMDNQLNLPQPIKVTAKTPPREGLAKHNNAIHQQQQPILRNINFEDDIFQLDGMQDDDAQNGYHHVGEEESDDEHVVEKRVYNRGRAGSIARSAPISMPQFNHAIHEIDAEDAKAGNEQKMDIASSIQMLARSIHADSVFGELPARPTLRYNSEF